jgi:hypothetical protein
MNGSSDPWLEGYLTYLEREHRRLSGGGIGRHYFKCAVAAYEAWRASRCPRYRHSAWLGIRVSCMWLAQLEGARNK